MSALVDLVSSQSRPLALPFLTYPGIFLTGATVRDVVTNPARQAAAQIALHERFQTRVLLTAMDLSAEAEAFGGTALISDWEVPSVPGRLVSNRHEAQQLKVPSPGTARTGVYIETVRLLKQHPGHALVLAGMIGPFSLAARLYGVSEALELTFAEPDLIKLLLDKSTEFLAGYAAAFKAAGADGVVMAEPTAGLLSPRAMREFSSAWVRRIAARVDDERFTLVYHNCAAKPVHLESVLDSGARAFHFGAPMDIRAALDRVPSDAVVCGNLDPTNVFYRGNPAEVANEVQRLLAATAGFRNFALSSGCDIPPRTPIENIAAFFVAARR